MNKCMSKGSKEVCLGQALKEWLVVVLKTKQQENFKIFLYELNSTY